MARDEDDLPVTRTSWPPDPGHRSVEELEAAIRRLEGEIEPARARITAKQSFR